MAGRRKGNEQNIIYILFSLVLGMLLGWLSGDLGRIPIVDGILNGLGIWVVLISLLAYFSKTAIMGALSSVCLIAGSIVAGFLRAFIGGWVMSSLLNQLLLCVMAALLGFIVWYAREKQWLGAICGSIPVSILIGEGYPIIYSRSAVLGFDIVAAIFLYIFLLKGRDRKLMALPFIIVAVALLVYFDPVSRILGGRI